MTSQNGEPLDAALTPEAELILERELNKWRTEIVALAYKIKSSQGTADKPINPQEIQSTIGQIRFTERNIAAEELSHRRSTLSRTAAFLVAGSILITAGGIFLKMDLTQADKWASVLGVTLGATAMIFTVVSAHMALRTSEAAKRAAKLAEAALDEAAFLRKWAEFEDQIRSTVAKHDGADSTRAPLGAVLQRYGTIQRLDDSELQLLRGVLQVRNQAAHTATGTLSKSSIQEAINTLESVTRRSGRTAH